MNGALSRVLVVDDTETNVDLLVGMLDEVYDVRVATDGAGALEAVAEEKPDMILLDVMMPGMDGYEVCRRLKASPETRDIPVIFLTAMTGENDEARGLSLGAVDYIAKPFSPELVKSRVNNQIELKRYRDRLEDLVRERTSELAATQEVAIYCLASLTETRDPETGGHILRTQRYVRTLAERLSRRPSYGSALDGATVALLYKSAPLHDIGKVGIPDRILLKPGRLTTEEFEVMKTHPALGRDAIEHAEKQLGMTVDFLACAKEIAYSHQEKWDGSGYPEGLAGTDIPLSARLMALADVYDALISRRVYKAPMSHAAATEIILAGLGSHFDPDVVGAFLAIQDEFQSIAQRFADSEQDRERELARLEAETAENIELGDAAKG